MPKHICFSAFHEELEFFGITGDAVSDCCHEEFQDKYATSLYISSGVAGGRGGAIAAPPLNFNDCLNLKLKISRIWEI